MPRPKGQSRVEQIRAWFRERRKRARQVWERTVEKLKRERDQKIRETRAKGPSVMYDSVNVSRIPADAKAVAGYINGWYVTWPALKARFPKAKKVSIAVTSAADADCLDIEPGNATPADAPAWIRRQLAKGAKFPILYANRSQMPAVLVELRKAGIKRESVRLWTAHYGQGKHICDDSCYSVKLGTTADATQWIEDHSRNLDINECRPSFWDGR